MLKTRFNSVFVRKGFYDYTGATKVSRAILNFQLRYLTDQCNPETGSMEINVIPDEPMVDEKLQIVITGLQPDQKVTLKSSFTDNKSDFFSSACFVSDATGNVHIHKQPSLSGTYTGLGNYPGNIGKHIQKQQVGGIIKKIIGSKPGDIEITQTMKTFMVFLSLAIVTRQILLVFYLRNPNNTSLNNVGKGPFPGVIDLFGGMGGLVESRAALLASKGFVSYALPYFNFDDLPKELVDTNFDYLQETVTWLNSLPNVIKDSLGVYGSSKGGDIALMLAIKCPQIRAVVNVNGFPFCCVFPLGPFTDYVKMHEGAYQIPGDEIRVKHSFSADFTPEKILKTWESDAKILYIVGEDDQCVHPRFARVLYNHYPEDKRHNLVIRRYPKVGHLIEPPYTPICLLTYNPTHKKYDVWGGIRKHQIRAEEDSWPRILNFFKSTLSPNSSCKYNNRTTSHV